MTGWGALTKIAQMQDVQLLNLFDSQVMRWNAAIQKFTNQDLPADMDALVQVLVNSLIVGTGPRRLNLLDSNLWDVIESIPNNYFSIDLKDGGVSKSKIAAAGTFPKSYISSSGTWGLSELPDIPKTKILTSGQWAVSEIPDLSSLYAPISHFHAIGDVVGLQPALDNKSNVGHTHAETEITGLVEDLASKASASHTHQKSDIIGLDKTIQALQKKAADMQKAIDKLQPKKQQKPVYHAMSIWSYAQGGERK